MPHRLMEKHDCEIARKNFVNFARLPPNAKSYEKWFHNFRDNFILWEKHFRCRQLFKSQNAIEYERKRHLRSKYWYIIHPFSKFCLFRGIFIFIVWLFVFFNDPFILAFYPHIFGDTDYVWFWFTVLLDGILLLESILCFLTGYTETQTSEIVIVPQRIMKHYLMTHFVFDVIPTLPFDFFLQTYWEMANYHVMSMLLNCSRLLRIVRMRTVLLNVKDIMNYFNVSEHLYVALCCLILFLYELHWMACLIYFVPQLRQAIQKKTYANSWVVKAFEATTENYSIFYRYIVTLHVANSQFLLIDNVAHEMDRMDEQMVCLLTMVVGIINLTIVLAIMMQVIMSSNISESKYQQLIIQLKEFSKKKKLPASLKYRLVLYYQSLFQKRYFKEQDIFAALTEQLGGEIFIFECRNLVKNISLFQELSRDTIQAILERLKHDLYLQNDVIYAVNMPVESIHFISYGTVMASLSTGQEFSHMVDGDMFGDVSIIYQSARAIVNLSALETSEVYRLEKKDFDELCAAFPDFKQKITRQAMQKYRYLKLLIDAKDEKDTPEMLFMMQLKETLEEKRIRLFTSKY